MLLPALAAGSRRDPVDAELTARLRSLGFTGRIESTLTERLGRPLDPRLADTGRLLWFDTITGLNDDNACAGCHSPAAGFGDTQSIAIGIDSNRVVGPDRTGPRNQRRAPMVINTAFYPSLMLNDRFSSLSGDPFDPSLGFLFPPPEGTSLSYLPHLLDGAGVHPADRTGGGGRLRVRRRQRRHPRRGRPPAQRFARVPAALRPRLPCGARRSADHLRDVRRRDRGVRVHAHVRERPDRPVRARRPGGADATQEKAGALLFFGDAGCVSCHQVSGRSNEMFSDFREHVLGVPQLVPATTNMLFDGPGANEDFGREQFTGDPADRYAFRTSPLRNVALQPTFMHDGAFTSLEAAIRFHLDVVAAALSYDPRDHGLDADLAGRIAPVDPILARLDPLVATPRKLGEQQLESLVAFVRDGLLDARARPERLRRLVPETLPSGRPPLTFQFPDRRR